MLEADEDDGSFSPSLPLASTLSRPAERGLPRNRNNWECCGLAIGSDTVISGRGRGSAEGRRRSESASEALVPRQNTRSDYGGAHTDLFDHSAAENEAVKKVLTPEEEERRKAEFIRVSHLSHPSSHRESVRLTRAFPEQQYGRIEEETEDDRAGLEALPDKALIDPSKLSKKQRKKAFDGVGKSTIRSSYCRAALMCPCSGRPTRSAEYEQDARAELGAR